MNTPWPDIIKHYALFDKEPTLIALYELCKYINNDELLRDSLHGHLSVHSIKIAQLPWSVDYTLINTMPYLCISPLIDGTIEFRYVDSFDSKKHWIRIEQPDRLITRLNSFLKQLCWVGKNYE